MLQTNYIGETEGSVGKRLAILAVAPILGLIYAVFLPFIGIAMFIKIGGSKLLGRALAPVTEGASFGWRPIEAYLTGKKAKKSEKK